MIGIYRFLTIWGLTITYFTFILGIYLQFKINVNRNDEDLNIFRAWKWFYILFEVSLTS
jgi:hypothetical protein